MASAERELVSPAGQSIFIAAAPFFLYVCVFFLCGRPVEREGMSYLPQTTLQGRGLDDISWNKAAESAEWGRSCWWVCKWAVSGAESSLQNTPFQYVTSRKKSSLLGHSQQMRSIKCPLTRRRKMCWRPDAAPSCIKRHLLKTLSIYISIGFRSHANVWGGV